MRLDEDLNELIIKTKVIDRREGKYVPFPENMDQRIRTCLEKQGIEMLYSHQAEMFARARRGENVVITTSTASGKTLSFLLPILQRLLENPLARAIFIYPTKALAADQLRVIRELLERLGEGTIEIGVYDGDTQPAERTRIRKSANIILTNPEMVNGAFLPNHSKYSFDLIFSNLEYIVVDELHSYRGAFGAHLANVFRRLHRICRFYGSNPQFLCSSATIANPLELAGRVCGGEFSLISEDGSPASRKTFHIIQPPEIKGKNDKIYGHVTAQKTAAQLLPVLVEQDCHFIAFGKTRRSVELLLKESRDKLDAAGFLSRGSSRKIAGYRGGYTPLERREIERKMIKGELTGLVSTNALELGIDIGKLDSTVLVGYPGTRASFWQRSGRAGRSQGEAVNYLILEDDPFDQYIAICPEWLFDQESENAIVDPDNLLIQLAHIRAAAAELPLSFDDIALFPDLGEILPVLMRAEEVKSLDSRFMWSGPAFPAGDYSLRNMDKSRYKFIMSEEGNPGGRVVTEMDETQAFHELYPGAVYLHEGELYEITKLDLVSRTAFGHKFTGDYYTVPAGEENTRILQERNEEALGRTTSHFGDINVSEIVMMFKKLQFHNHQNLGYVDLTVPLAKDYDTEGTWIRIPENVTRTFRAILQKSEDGTIVRNNHFDGMSHAVRHASMMTTMTAPEDIGTIVSGNALIPDGNVQEAVSLFIYDKYEGGLGYAEKIYEQMPKILNQAIALVKGCTCQDGCPACVGDYTLDKNMVLWGLQNLLEESEAPTSVKTAPTEVRPAVEKKFSFFTLPENWKAFCKEIELSGEDGSAFLRTIPMVQTAAHTLQVTVTTPFFKEWILQKENKKCILNIIKAHAVCPGDLDLAVTVLSNEDDRENKRGKLTRKYEGLTS